MIVVSSIIIMSILFLLYAVYCYFVWIDQFAPRESKEKSLSNSDLPILGRLASTRSSKKRKGSSLNMDHLKVTYLQFLWGMLFIFPNMVLLASKGIAIMLGRRWLKKHGFDTTEKHQVEETVAELLLETMLVTFFGSHNEEDIATFTFHHLPSMTNEDTLVVLESVTVLIDLKTRRFVKAEILDTKGKEPRPISAQDTMVLLFWNLIGNIHVKIHSEANWGCDPLVENKYIRQYAVSTVLYNYFGYKSFGEFCALLHSLGLTESPFKTFKDSVDFGLDCGMHTHDSLHHLGAKSKISYFVMCVRRHFLKLLPEFQDDFKDAVPEALFVGSIIHSLDHSQMGYVIHDDLWFEADEPYYAAMASQCRIVRASFIEDLPFLSWHCKCKDSEYPFFRQVYEKARHVDARLAGYMDCCIIQ